MTGRSAYAALQFGADRFGDSSNSLGVQLQRLEHLHSSAPCISTNNRLYGVGPKDHYFWDMLQARPKIKAGSGAAEDGIPSTVYLETAFAAIAHVHKMFAQRAGFERMCPNLSLCNILLSIGLPKSKSVHDFEDFRCISNSPILQK